ncbi:MAG: PEGA domain-containing protein [Candidatus Saccharibacteria bacterium]|nr:PEGA domain-containing protein [Candidatus Saccharibacteria bacterium]
MDFLDPKKKRAHKIRLYIGYGLMAVLILSLATLLLFQAYGYNYNLRTGDITQNGLLFVDAQPEPAQVMLNGENKGATDRRMVLPAGSYTLDLWREGYRDWSRSFLLGGGNIQRFVYPFLFPENLNTNVAQLYGSQPPRFITQSPDRQWLLAQRTSSVTVFDEIDLSGETVTSSALLIPEGVFTKGQNSRIELVEWSTNNRHVLLKHTFDAGTEYVLVDREQPNNSVNLSTEFTQTFSKVTLKDKSHDEFYLYNSANLTLRTRTLQDPESTLVLQNVNQYHTHGNDVVLYTAVDPKDNETVSLNILDGNGKHQLKELADAKNNLLDIARYDGAWYVVAGTPKEGKIYVYKNPVDALSRNPDKALIPAAILRIDDARYVSFSGNARSIAAQSGSKFAVYDAEKKAISRYDTDLDVPDQRQATWMDGHRLNLVSDGNVHVFDFDGTNQHGLVPSYGSYRTFFDRDYEAMFTIAPAPDINDRAALLRASLIVED